MAQMVVRVSEINSAVESAGDIASLYDDDVKLSGNGYGTCRIVPIPGVTAAEIRAVAASREPEMRETDDGDLEWNDSGIWRHVDVSPRHAHNGDFTDEEYDILGVDSPARNALWENITAAIASHPSNQRAVQ